jgi:hypothetical protein
MEEDPMPHRRSLAVPPLFALAMLTSLPVSAEDIDEQTIGPAPTMSCCWGNLPDQQGITFARTLQISLSPMSLPMLPLED